MKTLLPFIVLFICVQMLSQNTSATTGPYIKNFGNSFDLPNADLQLKNDVEYKVLFDVFSDNSKKTSLNPLLVTVARHLNMHGKQGVPLKNMKTVLVIHGSATPSVLKNETFEKEYKRENPDRELLDELIEAGVEIYVCGQSLHARGMTKKDLSPNIKMALSAITTLIDYQEKGYSLINFN